KTSSSRMVVVSRCAHWPGARREGWGVSPAILDRLSPCSRPRADDNRSDGKQRNAAGREKGAANEKSEAGFPRTSPDNIALSLSSDYVHRHVRHQIRDGRRLRRLRPNALRAGERC